MTLTFKGGHSISYCWKGLLTYLPRARLHVSGVQNVPVVADSLEEGVQFLIIGIDDVTEYKRCLVQNSDGSSLIQEGVLFQSIILSIGLNMCVAETVKKG